MEQWRKELWEVYTVWLQKEALLRVRKRAGLRLQFFTSEGVIQPVLERQHFSCTQLERNTHGFPAGSATSVGISLPLQGGTSYLPRDPLHQTCNRAARLFVQTFVDSLPVVTMICSHELRNIPNPYTLLNESRARCGLLLQSARRSSHGEVRQGADAYIASHATSAKMRTLSYTGNVTLLGSKICGNSVHARITASAPCN